MKLHKTDSRMMMKMLLGALLLLVGMPGISAPGQAAGAPVYDLDGSGVVDEGDATVIKAAFGKCQGKAGYDARADYDGDNCVTFVDYQQWYAAYQGQ